MTVGLDEATSETASARSTLHRLRARAVTRDYGSARALDGASLALEAGHIHALLGPNGAGKTTLLRLLSGVMEPTSGTIELHDGTRWVPGGWHARALVGLVPAGDRSFYLRLTGVQNLVFFARLHGMSRRVARRRAEEALRSVGLEHAGRRRVAEYSHGMQKRMAVARALLVEPPVLLVDEATHDLDPEGARTVHELVRDIARRGTAVLWATQRLEEIVGLADGVTVLRRGSTVFEGSVDQLRALTVRTRFVLHVQHRGELGPVLTDQLRAAVDTSVAIEPLGGRDRDHFRVALPEGLSLGTVMADLQAAALDVVGCREERSGLEDAFLALTEVER